MGGAAGPEAGPALTTVGLSPRASRLVASSSLPALSTSCLVGMVPPHIPWGARGWCQGQSLGSVHHFSIRGPLLLGGAPKPTTLPLLGRDFEQVSRFRSSVSFSSWIHRCLELEALLDSSSGLLISSLTSTTQVQPAPATTDTVGRSK